MLESKLDLHFNVKFDGESNDDSPKAQKPYLPLYYMEFIDLAPYRHKMKELNGKKILITMRLFWLEARFAFATYKVLVSGEVLVRYW